MAPSKRHGLRLTLGGAPATPHVIAGVPGTFRSDLPTPVGGDGEIELKRAQALDKDSSVPLVLAELDGAEAERALKQAERDVDASRRNLREAAAVAEGAEVSRVDDERKAVKPAKR